MVGKNQKVGAGLGAAVGGVGVQRGLLGEKKVRPVQGEVAVDFVDGDLVEALDAVCPATV